MNANKTTVVNVLLILGFSVISQLSWSATYYLTAAGANNAQLPTSWNTNPAGSGTTPSALGSSTGFDTNGDIFVVPSGITGSIGSDWTFGGAGTQTLTVLGSLTVSSGSVLTIYQKNAGTSNLLVASGGSLHLESTGTNQIIGSLGNPSTLVNQINLDIQSGSSLYTKNSAGVAGSGSQSVRSDLLTLTLSNTANYEFSGDSQVLGLTLTQVNSLTFSGTGLKTLYTGLTSITGNFTLSGTASTTAVTALAIGGSVSVGAGTSFDASAYTHLVGGDWYNAGSFLTNGTVHFNGVNAQTISSSNFNHVVFTGAGIKTLSGSISVKGDWTNSSIINPGTSSVSFTGDSDQTITETGSGGFYKLQMNGAGLKSLGTDIQVADQTILSNGILSIGTQNFKTLSFAGGSASSYVRTSDIGRVKQVIALNDTKNFPVGNSAYNPIELTNNQENPSGEFNVRVSDEAITNANDFTKLVNRRWYVSLSAAGDVNVTAKLSYNSGEQGAGYRVDSTQYMSMFNGSYWSYTLATLASSQITATGDIHDSTTFPDQYLSVGSGNAFAASKLIVSVFPTNPTLGVPNSVVTVKSVNSNEVATCVMTATPYAITATHTSLDGILLTGSIAQLSYESVLNNVNFTTPTTDVAAFLTVARSDGELLSSSNSLSFQVVAGNIFEPKTTGNFNSVSWRVSADGGVSWTDLSMPYNNNVFGETDLIRIPDGITTAINVSVSMYSMVVLGSVDLTTGGTLNLNHPAGNSTGFDLHVHGTFKNSGGDFVNNDGSNGTTYPIEMHGGVYWHARNGGSIPYATWLTLDGRPATCKVTGISSSALSAGLDQNFQNFEWDNALQSVSQTLTGNLTVTENFWLKNGTIATGSNFLIQAAVGNVIRTGGWINGNFRYFVPNTTNASLVFPIGDSNAYAPVSIVFRGITSGSGYLDARTDAAIPPVSSGLSQSNYVNRKWSIISNGVNFSDFTIALSYDQADIVGNLGTATMRRFSNNTWYNTGGSLSGSTFTASAQTAFSDFYIAEANCDTRFVWFGSVSSDWNVGENWCSGLVPDRTVDVLIPGGITTYPSVTNSATCKDLELGPDADLNTGMGSLYIFGNVVNQGSIVCGDTLGVLGITSQSFTGSGSIELNHFQLSNASGVISSANISVNGQLSLLTANPSATVGCLEMSSGAILSMGENATTTGASDVNGIVRREHVFAVGTEYRFGNQHTCLTFAGTGTRPVWIESKVQIGVATDEPTSVSRKYYFKVDATGYTDQVTVKLKYLASELNGNDETSLAFYDHHTATVFHEHGFSNRNPTDNWISLSGKTIGYLATASGNKYYFLDAVSSLRNTWIGVDTDWTVAENWTFGHAPNSSSFVLDELYIPSGKSRYPSINADITVKSIEIADGAVFQANSQHITVTGSSNAWIDGAGGFNYGTGTVNFISANPDSMVQISGYTNFHNLSLGANTYLQPKSNTTINIHNAIALTSGAKLDLLSNVNTFVYHTDSDLNLTNPTDGINTGYYHLNLNNSFGTITLPATLQVKGNLTISGAIAHNNGTVILNGSSEQLLNGSGNYVLHNLEIDNAAGVRLAALDSVSVASTLTILAGRKLRISPDASLAANTISNNGGEGGLVLESSAGMPNASLIFANMPSSPVPATVQMYSRATATTENEGVFSNYQWQYIGVPVAGLSKSFAALSGSFIAQFNDASHSGWEVVSSSLTPFRGYSITQASPKTIEWTGNLNNQSQVVAIPSHYTNDDTTPFGGYHLVANSFPSAVFIRDLVFSGSLGTTDYAIPTVYLFNTGASASASTGTNDTPGQYWAVPQNQAGLAGLPSSISSMQGFFVQSGYSPVATNATLTIPYVATMVNFAPMKSPKWQPKNDAELSIELIASKSSDKIWLFRNPVCTNTFDSGWDGEKLPGNVENVSLYVSAPDKNYQVYSSNSLHGTHISVSSPENERMTLKFNLKDEIFVNSFPEGIFLKDLVLNQVFEVENADFQYEFYSNSSDPVQRFEIVCKENLVAANELPESMEEVVIRAYTNEIRIDNRMQDDCNYQLFGISGNLIDQGSCLQNSTKLISRLNTNSVYVLKICSEDQTVTRKFIL